MKIKLNKLFAKRLSIVESPLMQTDKQTKVKPGHERLICENGQHYWLQSDGSKRETDWQLIDGMAVLKGSKINVDYDKYAQH